MARFTVTVCGLSITPAPPDTVTRLLYRPQPRPALLMFTTRLPFTMAGSSHGRSAEAEGLSAPPPRFCSATVCASGFGPWVKA